MFFHTLLLINIVAAIKDLSADKKWNAPKYEHKETFAP